MDVDVAQSQQEISLRVWSGLVYLGHDDRGADVVVEKHSSIKTYK